LENRRALPNLAEVRIIIVHNEAEYFGGAQRVLLNLVHGFHDARLQPIVMAVADSRTAQNLPPGTDLRPLPCNQPFRPQHLLAQISAVCQETDPNNETIIHGWAARDWELTAIAGRLTNHPTIGTLHDHPEAFFISRARQRLMGCAANFGLDHLVCVSAAVESACRSTGYQEGRLGVIHNGIPAAPPFTKQRSGTLRLGFMGNFSKQKGLHELFTMLERFAASYTGKWELHLAGQPQDDAGEKLWADVQQRFSRQAWWPAVKHAGWIDSPRDFLGSLDLLLFTSPQFDSLPTVLLEAAQCGTPALASDVGGVGEIVNHDETGWLYPAHDPASGAQQLLKILGMRNRWASVSQAAVTMVARNYSIECMTESYLKLYQRILAQRI